jgi:hypothetical protein
LGTLRQAEEAVDSADRAYRERKGRPMPPGASDDSTGRLWVVSFPDGEVYYLKTCEPASQIRKALRVYFKTEEDAQAAGYKRLNLAGC